MKLWLVSQEENNDYDTYDAYVCAAKDEVTAKSFMKLSKDPYGSWAFTAEAVKAELIGTAKRGTKEGIILDSFNAG